ncbi:hypothetical protein [Nonomuraea jabiensis]|uniref:Uncharacterized protein n=1 Tax=Nonomuraea jabiensis TaxID=882448 RepID=A0A7W9GCD3_9ACTN|nr:hypothetical protein [Nonomuraea jabiensis]MBB5781190.1 hypothetical protein [Nonomuraea jabiensis]
MPPAVTACGRAIDGRRRQSVSIHEKINTMMIGLTAGCGGYVFATAAAIAMAASPTCGHAALPCATGAGRPRTAEVSPARAW